uniref:C-type lectin domain-containing protein n=1 Tax=Fundulus heteroclitus TaxID=8078 RepID=A0A3Q2QUA7_FUNHE
KNLTEERDELKKEINNLEQPGWTLFGGSAYFVSPTKRTWEESRSYCQSKGADLMVINSIEEQNFANNFRKYMWIGLSDLETEGKWKWVDGTPLTTRFTHRCLIKNFNSEGSWNDAECGNENYWICEKNLNSIKCPSPIWRHR